MELLYLVIAVVLFIVVRKLTEPKVEHINQEKLNALLKEKKGYVFLDVRTPGEFNSNKLKGFKNMPLQSMRGKLDKLSKEDTIVLLCATGSRSMNAARILSKAGYTKLMNVKGGLSRLN